MDVCYVNERPTVVYFVERKHTYTHICTHMYTHARTHTQTHARAHTHTHTHREKHAHTYTSTHASVRARMHSCIQTHNSGERRFVTKYIFNESTQVPVLLIKAGVHLHDTASVLAENEQQQQPTPPKPDNQLTKQTSTYVHHQTQINFLIRCLDYVGEDIFFLLLLLPLPPCHIPSVHLRARVCVCVCM